MAKIKICLDAGHYGKYNRSPVVKSYYESDMTWKLHLLLKSELESLGFEVITTRTAQNTDLGLSARGKKAKGCKLFISLHSNACDTESVDRPVAIYLYDDNCGKIDEESKKIAGILGDVVEKVMQTNQKAQSYSRKSGNDRDGDGKKNDDYYGVLYGAHQVGVAGIILEHSFHTNTRAAKWLLEDSNLKKLAKAEAEVLAEYFGVKKVTEDFPANTEPEKEEPKKVETKKEVCTMEIKILRKGDKGNVVKAMQILLAGNGCKCGTSGADGDFGPATLAALKKYQEKKKLDVDGVCGPATWAALMGMK